MTKQVFICLLLVFTKAFSFCSFAQKTDSIKSITLKEISIFDTVKRDYHTKQSSSKIDNTIILYYTPSEQYIFYDYINKKFFDPVIKVIND